jgi:hypothetical protein
MGADVDANLAIRRSAQIAGTDHFTLFDEDDGVASDFHLTEEVGVEEDGGAAGALAADDVADEAATHGVKAGGRFIEENEFRLMDQSLCKADALKHPFGEAAKAAVAMRSEAYEIKIGRHAITELGRHEP